MSTSTHIPLPARAALVSVPAAFALLLWFHPMVGDWQGLRDATTRFQAVHLGMVLALPLLGLGIRALLDGMPGRAAAVGRFAVIPFVAFYVPYVAFEGFALGALGQELNALSPALRDAAAPGLVENMARNPILGEPGFFWGLGTIAWVVTIVATVLAFRRAHAPLAVQFLLAFSALIATHAPPLAPVGWACFAAAAAYVLRSRHAAGPQPAPPRIRAAA